MTLKLEALHSKSDLYTLKHRGCSAIRRCYVTTQQTVRAMRDKAKAICPQCGQPFTIDDEIEVKHPEQFPILSN
jgi:uncharacterized protein YbaR (Trm112 family)